MVARTDARKSSVFRNVLLLTGFACLFLIVGWSIYWYVAQEMAVRELRAQLQREEGRGRIWSCEKLETGGYPLQIAIDCRAPRLRIEAGAGPRLLAAERAVIRARLYAPTLVEIDLTGPASVEYGADKRSTADWTSLQLSLRGLPARLDRLSIVGRSLTVRTLDVTTTIDTLHAHLKRAAPVAMAPFGLTLGLAGVDSPALSKIAVPAKPALLTVLGVVTQLDAAGAGHWAERLEAWRMVGGRVSITALTLTAGGFALEGEGLVGLDQQHRPDGKLSVRLRNAGPALLALAAASGKLDQSTLPGRLAANILGRSGDLKADISAEDGALSIGPLRRLVPLAPLY